MQRRSFLQLGIGGLAAVMTGFRTRPTLGVYEIFDGNDIYHFIAWSERDAIDQIVKNSGYKSESEYVEDCGLQPLEVFRNDDDFILSILDEDGATVLKDTCKEWATCGRGFLASTAY